MSSSKEVLSIGHSTMSYDRFLQLCRDHGVTAVADVRSAPFSRRFPHFSRQILCDELRADQISYVFLGNELGGRPKDSDLFSDGAADYEKMAGIPKFTEGLDRVIEGAGRYKIALMCSEHDPLDCHRCLLVGRALKERDVTVNHILSNGATKTQAQIEEYLLSATGEDESQADIFSSFHERLASAYRRRVKKIAYSVMLPGRSKSIAAE